jgi:putative selenate reductase
MAGEMRPLSFESLLRWTLGELERHGSIFGIPRALFFTPRADAPYASVAFGHDLATPVGPAAGPHTQMAQNIVCAWLSGARFIELKTVQIMDRLDIPRPCIDMEDEGYNVEWSQELRLEQSADEYIKAWVLIHVLRRLLGLEDRPLGTIFNMSVGYNLEGIQSPPMTRFMDRLADASAEIAEMQALMRCQFPQFADLDIPACVADNVTLSTMHGCPPDEIEQIARYLLEERGLHTAVKLNPTLLGRERVMEILHDYLGFTEIDIPPRVFEHDLQYERALALIETLRGVAAARGLTFGLKLSNTLAMANHKGYLPGDEMYMSGRALYPITINLFYELSRHFGGDLNVSFSAGADALNVTAILASGAWSVTAVSDLLKPGGYSRLLQWLDNLAEDMEKLGLDSLEALQQDRLANLEREARRALEEPRYKKAYHPYGLPKVETSLPFFDCIAAPCVARCAVAQDVPAYAWLIAQGEYDRALEVILDRNPLPGVTGYVCTHLCQTGCTRNNYDEPVAIRALKRFAAERGKVALKQRPVSPHAPRVAVVGSGPSGLAAAYFLALNGVAVTVMEARDRPGGMLAIAPTFRLPAEVVQADIDRIAALGVEFSFSRPLKASPQTLLEEGFAAVYLAPGAQGSARLGIEGEDGAGVYQALDFLERVSRGEPVEAGRRVLVIGGGNTAMDAARTARRLTGGAVTVVYRRTRAEMPATEEEVEGLVAEGIALEELASPQRIVLENGRVVALECVRNELGAPGPDGRRQPVAVAGSEFRLPADSVIVAVGQQSDVAFLSGSGVVLSGRGTIVVDPQSGRAAEGIYAGGDAVRGPETIIAACADGRRAAEAICRQLGVSFERPAAEMPVLSAEDIARVKRQRARKSMQHRPLLLPPQRRGGFDLVEATLSEAAAQDEALRCLQCAALCDKCVEVCPNRANISITVEPVRWEVAELVCGPEGLVVQGVSPFEVRQSRQIIHIEDLCNACGNCATFCVHQGRPHLDKPRFFLDRDAFEGERDNAFYVTSEGGGLTLWRREKGETASLSLDSAGFVYEDSRVRLTLTADFMLKDARLKAAFSGSFSLRHAAEMAVLAPRISLIAHRISSIAYR